MTAVYHSYNNAGIECAAAGTKLRSNFVCEERRCKPSTGGQSADPSGYPDGWNNLAYVNNNVLNAVDPLGLCRIDENGNMTQDACNWEYFRYTYDVRKAGGVAATLYASCGGGTKTATISSGSHGFSINPQAFGFAIGSYTYTTSGDAQQVSLSFSCTAHDSTCDHEIRGSKTIDYYWYVSFEVTGYRTACGKEMDVTSRGIGKAFLREVVRNSYKCQVD